jgi:hypothetical protein
MHSRFEACFWARIGFLLMEKTIAARKRIWPAYRYYMGLNLGLFWQKRAYICADLGYGNRAVFWGLFWWKTGI